MYIFQDKLNLVLFPPARIQIHVNNLHDLAKSLGRAKGFGGLCQGDLCALPPLSAQIGRGDRSALALSSGNNR